MANDRFSPKADVRLPPTDDEVRAGEREPWRQRGEEDGRACAIAVGVEEELAGGAVVEMRSSASAAAAPMTKALASSAPVLRPVYTACSTRWCRRRR
ncbi:MAG: hypothetical protein R3C30_05790 [Hyphomonadaceae bacterium]